MSLAPCFGSSTSEVWNLRIEGTQFDDTYKVERDPQTLVLTLHNLISQESSNVFNATLLSCTGKIDVAVKVVRSEASSEAFIQSMVSCVDTPESARAPRVFFAGTTEQGENMITMERIRGLPVGEIDIGRTVFDNVLSQLCTSLQSWQKMFRFVHGDLGNLANVLFDGETVFVVDFETSRVKEGFRTIEAKQCRVLVNDTLDLLQYLTAWWEHEYVRRRAAEKQSYIAAFCEAVVGPFYEALATSCDILDDVSSLVRNHPNTVFVFLSTTENAHLEEYDNTLSVLRGEAHELTANLHTKLETCSCDAVMLPADGLGDYFDYTTVAQLKILKKKLAVGWWWPHNAVEFNRVRDCFRRRFEREPWHSCIRDSTTYPMTRPDNVLAALQTFIPEHTPWRKPLPESLRFAVVPSRAVATTAFLLPA